MPLHTPHTSNTASVILKRPNFPVYFQAVAVLTVSLTPISMFHLPQQLSVRLFAGCGFD